MKKKQLKWEELKTSYPFLDAIIPKVKDHYESILKIQKILDDEEWDSIAEDLVKRYLKLKRIKELYNTEDFQNKLNQEAQVAKTNYDNFSLPVFNKQGDLTTQLQKLEKEGFMFKTPIKLECTQRFYKMISEGLLSGESTHIVDNIAKDRKKGKTSPTLTHKQQIGLLDKLGFLDAPIFAELTIEKKAAILGNLINRNIQDTREILTYYNGKIDKNHPKANDNKEAVNTLLKINGLSINDKEK